MIQTCRRGKRPAWEEAAAHYIHREVSVPTVVCLLETYVLVFDEADDLGAAVAQDGPALPLPVRVLLDVVDVPA